MGGLLIYDNTFKKVVYAFTTYLRGTKLYKNVFNYEFLLPLYLNNLR